jgi:hypothetical protein
MPNPRTINYFESSRNKLSYKQSTINLRTILKTLKVSCFLFLVSSLSGCSFIGYSKPAALQITSTPEASIFIDGKHLGKTPFYSDQLKEGTYTLKLSASEATYVDKIDLFPGSLTVVNRELNNNYLAQSGEVLWLESGQNAAFIATSPADADITVDGKYQGKSPLQITDISPGDHKILLAKQGYIEKEFAIKTSSKYKLIASVTLASEIAKNPDTIKKPQIQTKKVEIVKTPQGFLRVRKDSSLDAPEVGRVNTGDQLDVIQETEDWVKISFEGKMGWISAQYTKKI